MKTAILLHLRQYKTCFYIIEHILVWPLWDHVNTLKPLYNEISDITGVVVSILVLEPVGWPL